MPHRHHEVFDSPGRHQVLSRRNEDMRILQISSGQTFELATAGFGKMDTIPESGLQRRAGSIENELRSFRRRDLSGGAVEILRQAPRQTTARNEIVEVQHGKLFKACSPFLLQDFRTFGGEAEFSAGGEFMDDMTDPR